MGSRTPAPMKTPPRIPLIKVPFPEWIEMSELAKDLPLMQLRRSVMDIYGNIFNNNIFNSS
jgi:hypothetical protein